MLQHLTKICQRLLTRQETYHSDPKLCDRAFHAAMGFRLTQTCIIGKIGTINVPNGPLNEKVENCQDLECIAGALCRSILISWFKKNMAYKKFLMKKKLH